MKKIHYEQAKIELMRRGVTLKQWAALHNFPYANVYRVFRGKYVEDGGKTGAILNAFQKEGFAMVEEEPRPSEFMTPQEVADLLRCESVNTIRNWARTRASGFPVPVKFGRNVRFLRSAIQDWVDSRCREAMIRRGDVEE